MHPRFRVYLGLVALLALAAVAVGAYLEYAALATLTDGDARDATALLLSGMGLTAAALVGLFSAWRFCKRESDVYQRFARFPDEPWKWRADWANGRVLSGDTFPLTKTSVTVLWIVVTIVLALAIRDGVPTLDDEFVWLLPGVPAIAVILLAATVRDLRRWYQYGASTLQLESTPVVPGGALSAVIETGITAAAIGEQTDRGRADNAMPVFRVALTCRREVTPDVRRSHSRRDVVVWREVADFGGVPAQDGSNRIAVPVLFDIPADLPASSVGSFADRTVWEIEVTCTGSSLGSYLALFPVPVFSATDREISQTFPVSTVYRSERIAAHEPGTMVADGIEVHNLRSNGVCVTLRRGRERRLAGILAQFAVLWAVVTGIIARQDVHVLIPLVVGAFTIIPLSEALRLLLVERRILADDTAIQLKRRVLGFERTRSIDASMIVELMVTAVSDIGMRERYRLAARTTSGEVISLAERIPDQVSAQWIGLQVTRGIGLPYPVAFRGAVVAAPPRGPIRRERRHNVPAAEEAA